MISNGLKLDMIFIQHVMGFLSPRQCSGIENTQLIKLINVIQQATCCNKQTSFCLFVCLRFIVPLENFSLIWRRHYNGEGLQILTYAQHSWPLSSEGSLTCHTYCDTGHPFIMVISEDPWNSHLLPTLLPLCISWPLIPKENKFWVKSVNVMYFFENLLLYFWT